MKIYLQIITPSVKTEIQEMEVKDGDIFIVKSNVELNAKQVHYMSTVINEVFKKEDNRKLLFSKGIDISVMPNEENIVSGG
jgi:hypothetical protein